MQGHLPLVSHLAAGYLGAAQSAGAGDSYPLGSGFQGAEHRPLHRPAEGDAALYLLGYRPGHQVGIELRLAYLLDIQLHLAADEGFQVLAYLVDTLPSPPDDHAGSGGMNGYQYLVRLTVYLHQGDGGIGIFLLDSPPQFHVLMQELQIVLSAEPLRLPVPDDTKSKA